MLAILYTTTDRIRGALGVSENEISDQRIVDTAIEDQLTVRLSVIRPDHAAIKTAGEAVGATDAEKLLYKILQLYCMYFGAATMLNAAQTLLFQEVTDAETTNTRFKPNDISELIDNVMGQMGLYEGMLNDEYEQANGPGYMVASIASPAYNPVTNNQPPVAFLAADLKLLELYGLP